MANKDITTSKIFAASLIALTVFSVITLACAIGFGVSVKNIQKQNRAAIENTLKNLEIQNNKGTTFTVVIKSDELNKITEEQYKDFLVKYNETQSNWLNFWLTFLGIALAFIGLIAPICFMKLYEDKKSEMDKIIKEAKEQKAKTKLNVKKMEEQLCEVDKKARQVEEQLAEVNKKSEQMSEDLARVKGYVDKTEALSKYNEGIQKQKKDKQDEAKKLFLEALELNPNNHTVLDQLADISEQEKQYDKALHYALEALKNTDNDTNKAFYLSRIAYYYAKQNDTENTNKAINEAFNLSMLPAIVCNCSFAMCESKQYERAIEYLKNILTSNVKSSAHYNLAEAYILNNQFKDAIETLKAYLPIQNRNQCYGIYTDDYEKWMKAIKSAEQNEVTAELIKLIDSLEKRER